MSIRLIRDAFEEGIQMASNGWFETYILHCLLLNELIVKSAELKEDLIVVLLWFNHMLPSHITKILCSETVILWNEYIYNSNESMSSGFERLFRSVLKMFSFHMKIAPKWIRKLYRSSISLYSVSVYVLTAKIIFIISIFSQWFSS